MTRLRASAMAMFFGLGLGLSPRAADAETPRVSNPAVQAKDAEPHATEGDRRSRRIVVYGIRAEAKDANLARQLTDRLLISLGRRTDLAVLGEAELKLMASHASDTKALAEADCAKADACLARLSEAADADEILLGRLGRLGDSTVVTLSLLDGKSAAVVKAGSCAAQTEEALVGALERAADELLGLTVGATPVDRPLEHTEGGSIAVMPVTGLEDQPSIAPSLTQLLGLELRKSGLSVITRDEILAMVDYAVDRKKCQGGDDDLTSCLVELGGALGVDYLATGAVGRFDESYVVILKLIDLGKAEVRARIAESYRGPVSELPRALRFATQTLLGQHLAGDGSLGLETDAVGEARIDERTKIALPLPAPIPGIKGGKHSVSISAEGYLPFYADVYVEPGPEAVRFRPELVPIPAPWYKTWWFWTTTGAVVAGTTTAILLATLPPKGSRLEVGY